MNQSFEVVAPDRLRIREGGGCMSAFGIPFFAAGVFLLLTTLGIVPVSHASELSPAAWPLFVLMGVAFTAVGGVLVFGRSWTTIDRSQQSVLKQWGLLTPLHERVVPLRGYTAVVLGFVEGDSDSAAASARRAAEQQVLQSHPDKSTTVSPRVERILGKLTQFAKGKGVTARHAEG